MMFFPDISWEKVSDSFFKGKGPSIEDLLRPGPFNRLNTNHNFSNFFIAFSGGGDSVLTLYFSVLLHRYLYKLTGQARTLTVYYLDHGNDISLAERQSREEVIDFYLQKLNLEPGLKVENLLKRADVNKVALKLKTSFERAGSKMRAREERLAHLRSNGMISFLGHNLSDWLETVVLRLNRGSLQINALPVSRPWVKGLQMRPLAFLTRQEVRNMLFELRLPYWDDPTNEDTSVPRNKIRSAELETSPDGLRTAARRSMQASLQTYSGWDCIVPGREYRLPLKNSIISYDTLRSALHLLGVGALSAHHVEEFESRQRVSAGPYVIEKEIWYGLTYLVARRGLSFCRPQPDQEIQKGVIHLNYGHKKLKKIFSEFKLSARQRRIASVIRNAGNSFEVEQVDLRPFGGKLIQSVNIRNQLTAQPGKKG